MALEAAVMFQSWRLKIREADAALSHQRLEEATSILLANQRELMQYQPALATAEKLTRAWIQQSLQQAASGSVSASWKAWDQAQKLNAQSVDVLQQRERLLDSLATAAESELAQGRLDSVFEVCEPAAARGLSSSRIRGVTQAARHWKSSLRLAQQGDYAQALAELGLANTAAPGLALLEEARRRFQADHDVCKRSLQDLHSALADRRWGAALSAAQEVLARAPEHSLAKQVYQQAWREVGLVSGHLGRTMPHLAAGKTSEPPAEHPSGRGARKMLWIDGVGAYLLCMGSEVVMGQPVSGSHVDIPILADISRRHCVIRRQGEGYVLIPAKPIVLDGKATTEAVVLGDRNRLELGSGVVLECRRPHALSGTMVLKIVSRHKTQPACDGILLMAETCVLGPARHAHVPCPDWPQDVVLVRHSGEQLLVRKAGEFTVDGETVKDRGGLSQNSLVAGQEFSFCVENLL